MPIANGSRFEIIDLEKPPESCNVIQDFPIAIFGAVGAYIPPVSLDTVMINVLFMIDSMLDLDIYYS